MISLLEGRGAGLRLRKPRHAGSKAAVAGQRPAPRVPTKWIMQSTGLRGQHNHVSAINRACVTVRLPMRALPWGPRHILQSAAGLATLVDVPARRLDAQQ